MAANKFISQSKIIPAIILFFCLSCFLQMTPAARGKTRTKVPTKDITIKAGLDFKEPFYVQFEDMRGNYVADPAIFRKVDQQEKRELPLETIYIRVLSGRTNELMSPRKHFPADQVARMESLTIYGNGEIAASLMPSSEQHRSFKPKPWPQAQMPKE